MLFFSNLSRNWLGRNIERLRRTFFRCLLPWVHDWSGVDIQSWLEEVRALLSLVWTLQFPQKTLSCTVSILSQREDGLEDSPNTFLSFHAQVKSCRTQQDIPSSSPRKACYIFRVDHECIPPHQERRVQLSWSVNGIVSALHIRDWACTMRKDSTPQLVIMTNWWFFIDVYTGSVVFMPELLTEWVLLDIGQL